MCTGRGHQCPHQLREALPVGPAPRRLAVWQPRQILLKHGVSSVMPRSADAVTLPSAPAGPVQRCGRKDRPVQLRDQPPRALRALVHLTHQSNPTARRKDMADGRTDRPTGPRRWDQGTHSTSQAPGDTRDPEHLDSVGGGPMFVQQLTHHVSAATSHAGPGRCTNLGAPSSPRSSWDCESRGRLCGPSRTRVSRSVVCHHGQPWSEVHTLNGKI